ncbi:hypothetical protein NL676_010848 [Syzygium grande]|nr:hypothetical protein NL676_010848 [Syzygium grande]
MNETFRSEVICIWCLKPASILIFTMLQGTIFKQSLCSSLYPQIVSGGLSMSLYIKTFWESAWCALTITGVDFRFGWRADSFFQKSQGVLVLMNHYST